MVLMTVVLVMGAASPAVVGLPCMVRYRTWDSNRCADLWVVDKKNRQPVVQHMVSILLTVLWRLEDDTWAVACHGWHACKPAACNDVRPSRGAPLQQRAQPHTSKHASNSFPCALSHSRLLRACSGSAAAAVSRIVSGGVDLKCAHGAFHKLITIAQGRLSDVGIAKATLQNSIASCQQRQSFFQRGMLLFLVLV
jgi:hypothetical protein